MDTAKNTTTIKTNTTVSYLGLVVMDKIANFKLIVLAHLKGLINPLAHSNPYLRQ